MVCTATLSAHDFPSAGGGQRYHHAWRGRGLQIWGKEPSLRNGLIQTRSALLFFFSFSPLLSFLPPSITSSPPSHLSISQTVVHLPPCAAAPICSLLTWPFTSDPIPTILIETKSHYGGLLFLPARLGERLCACVFCVWACVYVVPPFCVCDWGVSTWTWPSLSFVCIYLSGLL